MNGLANKINTEYDKKCKHCGHTKSEHYEKTRNFKCGMHQQIGVKGKITQCSCPGFEGG